MTCPEFRLVTTTASKVLLAALCIVGCHPESAPEVPGASASVDEVTQEERIALRDTEGARRLSNPEGEALLDVDPKVSPYKPVLPRHIWKYTQEFRVVAHICVGRSGLVDRAEATKFAHPEIAQAAVRAIIGWRYKPLRIEGVRTPFCYDQPMTLQRETDPGAKGQKFEAVTQ